MFQNIKSFSKAVLGVILSALRLKYQEVRNFYRFATKHLFRKDTHFVTASYIRVSATLSLGFRNGFVSVRGRSTFRVGLYSNMFSLKIPRVRWKKEFGREGEVSRKVGDSFDPDRGGTNESPVVRHGD